MHVGKQFVRYSVFGVTAFVCDLIMLQVFLYLGWWYVAAVAVAFALASSGHCMANRFYTFPETTTGFFRAYLSYLSINVLSIALLTVLVALLVEMFGVEVLVAKVLCAGVVGVFGFFMQRRFTFKVH